MLETVKNVLANLAKKPVTRMYPKVKRDFFENIRGRLQNDMGKCVLCGMCQRVCPSGCIRVDRTAGKWEYDPFECVLCGVCVEKCPRKSLTLAGEYRKPSAAKYRVELLRENREDEKAAGKVKNLA
jgi:formate hydrogenlyase subunit 6/NADH:ubiquinone oxidoreductase subunit I